MHIAILFINIGSYHAARLRAVDVACRWRGWTLTALQVTDNTLQHPWGDLKNEITFSLETLLPSTTTSATVNVGADSVVAVQALNSYLDRLRPNIVLVPGWGFPVSRAALQWCRNHQVPAILMSESKKDDEERVWWKELIKSQRYVRRFAAALVGGELHRQYLIELGLAPEHIFLGYDAVDNDYFEKSTQSVKSNPQDARREHPNIPSQSYFLSLTRFLPRKNLSRLILAYAAYRQKIRADQPWDLVLCGAGEEQASLLKLIEENGLSSNIHLPGFLSYEALPNWYGLAGAFVHPALQEQWGLVVNEACASGLPILCSDTVGARFHLVQDNQNGFLFNPKSVEEMTQALIKTHKLTAEQRFQMGTMSQELVTDFGPERFADGVLCAINSSTDGSSKLSSNFRP